MKDKDAVTIIFVMSVTILSIATILICTSISTHYENHYYPTTMIITRLDHDNDIIIMEDFNGHVWMYDGIEDNLIGDIMSCIMYNNKTESIYDDKIVKMKYTGYVEITGNP